MFGLIAKIAIAALSGGGLAYITGACGSGAVRRGEEDSGLDAQGMDANGRTDGGPKPDGGKDGGDIPDAAGSDAADGGLQDGGDGGPRPRRGINDTYASLRSFGCESVSDIDVILEEGRDPYLGLLCETTGGTQFLKCPIRPWEGAPPRGEGTSVTCDALANLTHDGLAAGDRAIFHYDLGNRQSLISFFRPSSQRNLLLEIFNRETRELAQSIPFSEYSRVSGGGTIQYPLAPAQGALRIGEKLFVASMFENAAEERLQGGLFVFDRGASGWQKPLERQFELTSSLAPGPLFELDGGCFGVVNKGYVHTRGTEGSTIDRFCLSEGGLLTFERRIPDEREGRLPPLQWLPEATLSLDKTTLWIGSLTLAESGTAGKLMALPLVGGSLQQVEIPELGTKIKGIQIFGSAVYVTGFSGHWFTIEWRDGRFGSVSCLPRLGSEVWSQELWNWDGVVYTVVSTGPGERTGGHLKLVAAKLDLLERTEYPPCAR